MTFKGSATRARDSSVQLPRVNDDIHQNLRHGCGFQTQTDVDGVFRKDCCLEQKSQNLSSKKSKPFKLTLVNVDPKK